MKLLLRASVIAFLLSFAFPPQGIYDIKIKDLDGGVTALSKYTGKKMIFVILSGKEKDSTLNELAAFCTKYKDSAVVFGVLSIEDGYSDAGKGSVKQLIKSKIPGLVLTEGMYTRKTSPGQSELTQWLTHTEQNHRFGNDITGPGCKFFVDVTGELYAALSPHTPLSSPVIVRVMSRHVRPVQPAPAPQQKNNQALPTHS